MFGSPDQKDSGPPLSQAVSPEYQTNTDFESSSAVQ